MPYIYEFTIYWGVLHPVAVRSIWTFTFSLGGGHNQYMHVYIYIHYFIIVAGQQLEYRLITFSELHLIIFKKAIF